jgi:hypothetical protein
MKMIWPSLLFIVILAACSNTVNSENLSGTWDYIHIEDLNPNSENPTTDQDLKDAKPFIHFTRENKLEIVWAGKVLSSGTFRMDGKMIRYKEDLPDGTQREFPFLVKSLSETQIIFETMSREGTRVTAVKRK